MIDLGYIHNESCLKTMTRMSSQSIDLIVTSPPYWVGKSYERDVAYTEYTDMMTECFVQFGRVLKPGCYAVVNFGDYFNSGNRFYESDVPACYPASINYYRWGVETAGMDLQATRIWRKQFARMGIPFVCNTHPRPVFDYEHVWTFRKKNGDRSEFVNDRKLSQRGVIGENWTSSAQIDKHCASFPIELPMWAINVYSRSQADVVYDPFMGRGTTALAAIQTSRQWMGSEIDMNYVDAANKRIEDYRVTLSTLENNDG